MRTYLVTDVRTRTSQQADLATAATIAELEPDQIEYMLDEEGVYETEQYTITDVVEVEHLAL